MIASKAWLTLGAGSFCGAAVWGLSIAVTGVREPFDSNTLYYPAAMFLSGILASSFSPRHWWLAVIGIFAGERLYAFVMLPETRDWLLFGIVVNALVPTWLPAALGAIGVFITDRWLAKRRGGCDESKP